MTDKPDLKQFETLLAARHSCRGFLADQIDDAKITAIVAAAQRVPSWCNAQPWQVIITRGEATEGFRAAMAAAVQTAAHNADIAFPAAYTGIYKDRRSVCGWQLYAVVGVQKGDRAASTAQMVENYRFFGAPHVAVITAPKNLGAYGVLDCGAFVTGFMLAAEAAGVASIAQAAVAGYSDQVRSHFGIAEDRNVVCVVSFGLRDEAHPANGFRTDRAAFEQVIDWR
ncbi:MAG: nitroreductase [Rhodobacter sp.]|jgi:nitroreductase|nr:nitroreductase [Rhodobacter sp.]